MSIAIFIAFMAGCMLGLCVCWLIEHVNELRKLDRDTDSLMRRGIKRIPSHELDELMRRRDNVIPIRAFDKQLEISSGGRPLRWEP